MPGTESLRKIARLVTTHNAEGKAVFATVVGDRAELKSVDNDSALFGLQYCTEDFPVDMNDDKDIGVYQKYSAEPPGLVISNGTVLRTVEMSPGLTSPMHRTVSLDYGIVLDGDVELILDSGERRAMRAGDIAIQRGTMHAWRNMSDTEPARMLYVLQPSKPLQVAGQKLSEDLESMKGVRAST